MTLISYQVTIEISKHTPLPLWLPSRRADNGAPPLPEQTVQFQCIFTSVRGGSLNRGLINAANHDGWLNNFIVLFPASLEISCICDASRNVTSPPGSCMGGGGEGGTHSTPRIHQALEGGSVQLVRVTRMTV